VLAGNRSSTPSSKASYSEAAKPIYMSQLLLIPVLAAQLLITLSPRLEVLPLAGVGFPPLTYVPASVDAVDAVVVDAVYFNPAA